jgi:hypothetical protein
MVGLSGKPGIVSVGTHVRGFTGIIAIKLQIGTPKVILVPNFHRAAITRL